MRHLHHRPSVRRAVAWALLALMASPALAGGTYYFSDCTAAWVSGYPGEGTGLTLAESVGSACTIVHNGHGGDGWYGCIDHTAAQGSNLNPWCLDPHNLGIRNSFEQMEDGGGDDLQPGDTAVLCSGTCAAFPPCIIPIDGGYAPYPYCVSTSIWPLQGHTCPSGAAWYGSPCILDANGGGTSGFPITIKAFSGQHDIRITGDTNGNGLFDVGEPASFFNNREATGGSKDGKGWWTFEGFTIEKFAGNTFYMVQNVDSTTTLKSMTLRYLGAGKVGQCSDLGNENTCASVDVNGLPLPAFYGQTGAANTVGMYDVGCDATNQKTFQEPRTFFTWGGNDGSTFVLRDSTLYQSCALVMRANGNCFNNPGSASAQLCEAGGAQQFIHNLIYSVNGLGNGHQNSNVLWQNNTAYDFLGGIGLEENTHGAVIEDNDLSCRGIYRTGPSRNCNTMISVTDGDTPGECAATLAGNPCASGCGCTTHDIYIRRNKVWAAAPGLAKAGIIYWGHGLNAPTDPLTPMIENNMIWGINPPNGCSNGNNDIDRIRESTLSVMTQDPATIRNNSVSLNKCPVYIRTGTSSTFGGSNAVAHSVTDNIFDRASDTAEVVQFGATTGGSTITNNDIYEASGVVARSCLTDATNCSGGTTYSCADPIVGLGGGNTNFCRLPPASVSDPSEAQWNLHLTGSDTTCIDAGISGPATDIDGDARLATLDVGADEVVAQANGKRRVL